MIGGIMGKLSERISYVPEQSGSVGRIDSLVKG